jgi:hypothetical protein
MLILECSQGCYVVKNWPGDLDLWPWKSIGFQIFIRTKYVPCLVKIHWKMLILECSQGCYRVKIRPCDLDLWPWKSIGFQILLRTKYVPSLVKIHWRMLILECSQRCYGRTEERMEGRKDGRTATLCSKGQKFTWVLFFADQWLANKAKIRYPRK